MNLPRHTLSSSVVSPAFVSAHFCAAETSRQGAVSAAAAPPLGRAAGATGSREPAQASSPGAHASGLGIDAEGATNLFACATSSGFFVAQASPLKIVARRDFPAAHGGLSHAAAVDDSSLLVLVGGGRVPRFAPNKVVLWDEAAEVLASRKPPEAARTAHVLPSPRASTVFSAGSGFDRESISGRGEASQRAAPARAGEGKTADRLTEAERRIQDWRHTAGDRRSSDKGKARAVDPDELEDDNVQASASAASPTASLASSRLSVASSASAHELSQSLFDRDAFASEDERDERSIAASSAGLDDPFAVTPPRELSPAAARTPREEAAPAARPDSEPQPLPKTSQRERIVRPPLSPVENVARAERRDATTEADRPAAASRRGREVAELEFAEAVGGVCVRSFEVAAHATENEAATRASSDARRKPNFGDGAAPGDRARTDRAVILAVLLRKRAVVFEIGAGAEAGASLEIRQRASTEISEQGTAGLAALAPFPGRSSALLALPGRQAGHVQLLRIPLQSSRSSAAGATSILAAHSAPLAALCLSPCGTLLATASKRGTLVRIWSTVKPASNGSGRPQVVATLLRELRRGTDPARILSMAFAPDCSSIAAASEKGTVHIFNLTAAAAAPSDGARPPSSPGKAFGLSKGANRFLPAALGDIASAIPASMMPRYFQSTWSVAQYRIPLRSFSAQGTAALTRPTRSKKGASGDTSSTAPVGGGGARSTEGAWATMLGRVDDVRRGEPGAEERVFLAWVRAPPAPDAKAGAAPASRTSRRDAPAVEPATQGGAFHLLALTTSGGYYRISLDDDARNGGGTPQRRSSEELHEASASAVLDMYREDEAASAAAAASAASAAKRRARQAPEEKGCHLEEFRTFGAAESEWS